MLFRETARSGHARSGILTLPSGKNDASGPVPLSIATPIFMPVGTRASVKALRQEDLEEIGYDLILSNTYHLFLRPGEIVSRVGGLKKFMAWGRGILTDSGGFQVYSLADRVKFQKDGVEFRSHIDGTAHLFTPESVIDFQLGLGSDVMMVLDDCPPADADAQRIRESMDRTHRWAGRALEYFERRRVAGFSHGRRPSLFGIVQGGIDEQLRLESLEVVQSFAFDGVAVGGLSVGETPEDFERILEFLGGRLDAARPRYLMGVGTVPYILEAVRAGFDMFDCVLPTRNARHGQVFTREGRLHLKNRSLADSNEPMDASCSCRVCRRYSRAYLRHLFMSGEMLGPVLATHHNLHFFKAFMDDLRTSIGQGIFAEFYARWKNLAW